MNWYVQNGGGLYTHDPVDLIWRLQSLDWFVVKILPWSSRSNMASVFCRCLLGFICIRGGLKGGLRGSPPPSWFIFFNLMKVNTILKITTLSSLNRWKYRLRDSPVSDTPKLAYVGRHNIYESWCFQVIVNNYSTCRLKKNR